MPTCASKPHCNRLLRRAFGGFGFQLWGFVEFGAGGSRVTVRIRLDPPLTLCLTHPQSSLFGPFKAENKALYTACATPKTSILVPMVERRKLEECCD